MSRFLSDYGMLLVLAALCVYFSAVTWDEQYPRGASAGRQVASLIISRHDPGTRVAIVSVTTAEEMEFARTVDALLRRAGFQVVALVHGQAPDVRAALQALDDARRPEVLACSSRVAQWSLFREGGSRLLPSAEVFAPRSYRWPNFLKTENLLNIANQIAVIAIIAAGMTMVIITGGIDLSVGSLVALSAVLAAVWMRDLAGGREASVVGMIACCLGAVLTCGLVGTGTGCLVTLFRKPPQIPPFIVTLSVMLMASGVAYRVSDGQSVNQVPDAFVWLGRGADLAGIPNAVVLMLIVYAAAHILMKHFAIGRYIYAVGGNNEAARLSGVPVRQVLIFVYAMCGMLAGLGGIVLASQLKSGAPTYGLMYELYVIAAVVVGGTSLAGGEGRVLGTLIGAFIIAVIQNGMNLTGLESYTQKIVLGAIILAAVLLDRLKKQVR